MLHQDIINSSYYIMYAFFFLIYSEMNSVEIQ